MRNQRLKYYRAFEHRLEFEVGLGSKLQTAFYLNYGYSKGIETAGNVDHLVAESAYSFANEWKLKLSDPTANRIGSAVYFEYTLRTEETELEAKIILDKQIGKVTQALNVSGEYEFKNEFSDNNDQIVVNKEHEIKLNLNYGLAYQLHKNFYLAMELSSNNLYEENEWKFSVLSAGLGLSYNMSGFWVNLSCMPQISNLITSNQELSDNEKLQTRLIFSYVF